MEAGHPTIVRWLLGPGPGGDRGYLWARWIFLRALGLIYLSAFYSLLFQIRGLIGPDGILPAGQYLSLVERQLGAERFWFAPTLLWLGSGPVALKLVCWTGLLASVLLALNVWPRAALAVCSVNFLSFVSAAQEFSSYQSDGMLLEAGFLSLFFAPPGLRPRLGEQHPPSRASLFMLRWLWFRIYFESGVVKLASGEPQWRHLTAMDHYYENGPLPNWIGWYAQQLPHWFQASAALFTLVAELGLAWMLFLPRRFRIICFALVTPFQIGIILSANLTFLNYFVLALGFLLLDDRFYHEVFRRLGVKVRAASPEAVATEQHEGVAHLGGTAGEIDGPAFVQALRGIGRTFEGFRRFSPLARRLSTTLTGICLGWVFYVTTALLLFLLFPRLPIPTAPIEALEPFRIANQYGLFAVMTRARYEIEFQGTGDGKTWMPYPFRYKPQDPRQPPRIHAPYQPRFDWNLWFASLGQWRDYPFVVKTEALLLQNRASVLSLFARNPFPGEPPRQVRAVVWQYWFTDLATKRREGIWWRRELRGLYAPTLEREPDGKIVAVEWPETSLAPGQPER